MATPQLRCEDVVREAMVERYLTRNLLPSETERFESHYINCDRCQRDLELGAALRRSFRDTVSDSVEPRAMEVTPSRRWAKGIAAMAAVLVGAIAIARWPADRAPLHSLGALSAAPIYLGIPVRVDAPAKGDALFDAAMRAYESARFAEAARELTDAIRAGADVPPAHFFLGASQLMDGHPRNAVDALSRVIDAGNSPYRAEARYYRAKAWLQLGDRERALTDLDAIGGEEGVVGAQSRALRDSVMGVIVR